MLSWFKKRKKEDPVQEVFVDEWMKNDYIVVPNSTTVDDLKEYQKLIVLRKPEGEVRVVVDYGLQYANVDKFHNDTTNDNANFFDLAKDVTRIIPTYINTKAIESDCDDLDEQELKEIAASLHETALEFNNDNANDLKEFKSVEDFELPIVNLDQEYGQVLQTRIEIANAKFSKAKKSFSKSETDVDDIDSVDILTDNDLDARNSWIDVQNYFEDVEEVENRTNNLDEDKTLSPFYLPAVQPLFRNFAETDFSEATEFNKIDEIDYQLYAQESGVVIDNEDAIIEYDETQSNDVIETINENATVISEDDVFENNEEFINLNQDSNGDPEILIDDWNQFVEQKPEEPKVLSFFKNEVNQVDNSLYVQNEHISKSHNFYKESSNRNITYEKVILDKKRGIYNIRRVLAKEK